MNILFIGDVVGQMGCDHVRKVLPSLKKLYNIDMVIANGENSAQGNGISPDSADFLMASGVDVITTGNHAFRRRQMDETYRASDYIIRPYNYGSECVGKGICIYDFGSHSVAVVNMMGTLYLQNLDNPFHAIDEVLSKIETRNIIVDFHAEATSEKKAMGYYLSGRVSAVIGTHTHVQTADEEIIDDYTGYITDVGMTGPKESVLGVDKDIIISRFKTNYPYRFDYADSSCIMNAILIEIDEKLGKCTKISRINIE